MTIRQSQVQSLELFAERGKAGFTAQELAEENEITVPSARSRMIRMQEHGWLKSKEVAGPTSPRMLYSITAEGRKALRTGKKFWAARN